MFNISKQNNSTSEKEGQTNSNSINESVNVELKKINNRLMWLIFLVSLHSIANKVSKYDLEIEIQDLKTKINILMLYTIEPSEPIKYDDAETYSL